jgi:hypothetical protein
VRSRTLRVKVCLPLWPSSLFAPSTHAAHNTTTAAISLHFFERVGFSMNPPRKWTTRFKYAELD